MNKTYTLKELADIGAKASWHSMTDFRSALVRMDKDHPEYHLDVQLREAFTKAVLDAIGYEFPKDEEREAFSKWWETSNLQTFCNADDAFEAWKAGREELRRSQSLDKRPTEPVEPAWIPWSGGECPLSDGMELEAKFRSGTLFKGEGRAGRWNHRGSGGDIVAYRVIQ